ncbi:hypothetical protein OOJ74_08940, partial [Venenivibrio stagnispumantis]|nr:hypothetical protein [Venenivibrio stagnispumantis]
IGEQSRNSPADHDPDNIRAYGVKDNLRIEGISNDLTIIMYGAKLKLKDGMKFGAFDPETGEPRPYSPTINELKYRADTGFIFNIVENPLSN